MFVRRTRKGNKIGQNEEGVKWTMSTDTNRQDRAFPARDEEGEEGEEKRSRETMGKKQESKRVRKELTTC